MPRLLSILCACLLLSARQAGAAETVRPGRWLDPSIWSGGAVPGEGATALLRHAVVLDASAVIGTGGAGAALTVDPGAALTLASSATLRVRGDVAVNGAPLTLEAGSAIELDSSGAQGRGLLVGDGTAAGARLELRGRGDALSVVRSRGGAARIVVAAGASLSASHALFEGLGGADEAAVSFAPSAAGIFALEGAIFDGGGELMTSGNIPEGGIFSLRQVEFRNTRSALSLTVNAYPAKNGGVREISQSHFDQPVRLWPGRGFSIRENVFSGAFEILEGEWELFEENLVRMDGRDLRIAGSTARNYWLVDNPSAVNPHFLQVGTFGGNVTVREDIFEFTGSDANGDCIMAGVPPVRAELTITRNLILPNAAGNSSCTLFSLLGNANLSVRAEHNTYIIGSQGAAVGETYAGHPRMLESFRANLAWDSQPRGHKLYDSGNNERVIDLVPAESVDYNAGWNFLAGSNGSGYHNLEFAAGSPGVHDVVADPQFRDPSRNIRSWDQSLGGPGTVAHALAELARPDGAYSIAGLRAYVLDGFVPSNPALRGAGGDGLDIGAVQVGALPPSVAPPTPASPGSTATSPAASSTPTRRPTATSLPLPGGASSPPGPAGTAAIPDPPAPTPIGDAPNGALTPSSVPPTPGPAEESSVPPGPSPTVTPPFEAPRSACECRTRCRTLHSRGRRFSRCIRLRSCSGSSVRLGSVLCEYSPRLRHPTQCGREFRGACRGRRRIAST